MNQDGKQTTDPTVILAGMNRGKSESKYHRDQILYAQGDPANCLFYIQAGNVKVAVVSPEGKEAVVGILQPGDFCGEECLNGHRLRIAAVTALTECTLVRLERLSVGRAF